MCYSKICYIHKIDAAVVLLDPKNSEKYEIPLFSCRNDSSTGKFQRRTFSLQKLSPVGNVFTNLPSPSPQCPGHDCCPLQWRTPDIAKCGLLHNISTWRHGEPISQSSARQCLHKALVFVLDPWIGSLPLLGRLLDIKDSLEVTGSMNSGL